MKTTEKGKGAKSPDVRVPIVLWIRLCDALSCSPDAEIEAVVVKAERLIPSLIKRVRDLAALSKAGGEAK